MRTLVEIPERQIRDLAVICRLEQVSRAELVRRAISAYLEKRKPPVGVAFGLWQERGVDGLAYQEQMRSEW